MAIPPPDLFDEVDPVASPPAPRPARPVSSTAASSSMSTAEVRGVQPRRSRWPLLVGGAIVLLVGIAVAVVLVRRSLVPAANTNAQNASVTSGLPENANTNAPAAGLLADPVNVTDDKDRDGILDAAEQKLGTKDSVADTDGDGLSDYDEANVYKTNPLKPDTDGDGNADGAEVEKGYNPNGAGLLLDFEAARKQLTP